MNVDRPLRVLHLYANYKWTGPADCAIRCARWQRRAGLDVTFAQARWTLPGAEHRMATELWAARLPVLGGLELRKHFHVRSTLRDAATLRRRLRGESFDVVHTHQLADHLIAALAVRRFGPRRPLVVRSLYEPRLGKVGWRGRVTFRATDGVVAPTEACRREVIGEFGLEPDVVLYQDPPTEPPRTDVGGDLCGEWGLGPDAFAIGITARIQPHRRFELLWEVARRVVAVRPQAHFVLLGRGNEADTERFVTAPLRALGLEAHVALPGYLREPLYSRALRSLDAFVFLVPGSDGTCRAMREALARGLPVVATPRGMLPDLCGAHPALPGIGPAGRIADERPEALAAALIALIDDPEARAQLSRAGLARTRGPMDPAAATDRLVDLYRRLRARGGAS